MHETRVIADLLRRIEAAVAAEGARRAVAVEIWLGALSSFSAAHLGEHFAAAARGTVADGAALSITESADADHPLAGEVVLDSVAVED